VSLESIWEMYEGAMDTDTAKKVFKQALRFGYAAIAQRQDATTGNLEKLVELLANLKR